VVSGEAALNQEAKNTRPVLVAQTGHTGSQWGGVRLALTHDDRFLFSGGYFGVCMWEVSTGGRFAPFAASRRRFPPSLFPAMANFWRTAARTRPFKAHKDQRVYSVAVSKDDTLLATGCADGSVALWKLSDGTMVRNLPGHDEMVRSVAFTRNCKWLAIGSWNGNTRILDPFTGQVIRTLVSKKERVTSLAISGDDRFLVTGIYEPLHRKSEISVGYFKTALLPNLPKMLILLECSTQEI
jgi:WD40 repeat protein